MAKFIAAAVQTASCGFDTPATLERAATYAARAAAAGARLVVFPEAFIGGYPKGLDFGARIGSRTPLGRATFARYAAAAITVPGPETEQLGAIAREHNVHLVTGAIERDGGTLYCSVLFFNPAGSLTGKHRKLMPTASERLVWGFGDGTTLPVLQTPLGRLGAVICWENYMPALRLAMYAQNIELYCAPTADDRETWLPTMRHIALEGRCFVISACQFARRGDWPQDYPLSPDTTPDTILMRGGSCIIGPMGQILAQPVFDQDCIVTAELDVAEIPAAKYDFDATGHYARPDVFTLHVNTQAQQAVTGLEG